MQGCVGLPDFRGQVDYVHRLRIWQASSYLIGLHIFFVDVLTELGIPMFILLLCWL
jgi:hypothetical protein